MAMWCQSQRSQYLRVVLEAEREIARLCGHYESGGSFDGTVVFRIERVGGDGASGFSGRSVSDGTDGGGKGGADVGDAGEIADVGGV